VIALRLAAAAEVVFRRLQLLTDNPAPAAVQEAHCGPQRRSAASDKYRPKKPLLDCVRSGIDK
jgi:hypothetical protein